MALVDRNGRTYLYRSIRRNGRVTSEYVASGELAALLGEEACLERLERAERLDRQRSDRAKLEKLEQSLDDLVKQAKALAGNALAAAGYHQHHRGEWRKRHNMSQSVVVRVHEPKPDERSANVIAAEILINSLIGKEANEKRRERHRRELEEVARELAGPDPSPVERMLAETAALSWYALRRHEVYAAGCDSSERYQRYVLPRPSTAHEHPEDAGHRAPACHSGRADQPCPPATQPSEHREPRRTAYRDRPDNAPRIA